MDKLLKTVCCWCAVIGHWSKHRIFQLDAPWATKSVKGVWAGTLNDTNEQPDGWTGFLI